MINPDAKSDFMLAFMQTEDEVKNYFFEMQQLAPDDEQLWMTYPKGSSKRYKAQINSDSGWSSLARFDYEAVRQIAIDEDWSALRFRKTTYVKVVKRRFSVKDQNK